MSQFRYYERGAFTVIILRRLPYKVCTIPFAATCSPGFNRKNFVQMHSCVTQYTDAQKIIKTVAYMQPHKTWSRSLSKKKKASFIRMALAWEHETDTIAIGQSLCHLGN